MRLALMQPYFLPYIGYYQLLHAVDHFVLHDDAQFSKGGWINRNRILLNGEVTFLTVPLQRSSDYATIRDRRISNSFDTAKALRVLDAAYAKADCWSQTRPLIASIIQCESRNLAEFNSAGLRSIAHDLGIQTPITPLSELALTTMTRGQDKVLDVCEMFGATEYVNPIGGVGLYKRDSFLERGIKLKFLSSRLSPYAQPAPEFVPALSVVDLLANVGLEATCSRASSDYDIIDG